MKKIGSSHNNTHQPELNKEIYESLYMCGYDDIAMSEHFGINIIKAIRYREMLHLKPNFKYRLRRDKKLDIYSKSRFGIELKAFKTFYEAGADDNDLSAIFQVPKYAIKAIRGELRYKSNTKPMLSTAERYNFLFESGLNTEDVATICNVSIKIAKEWEKKLGYSTRMNISIEEDDFKFEPDPESLFCDTEFLSELVNKKLNSKIKECK
jgi:hypothetical protein